MISLEIIILNLSGNADTLTELRKATMFFQQKGKWIIKNTYLLNKISNLIVKEVTKNRTNIEIINLIKEKYNRITTHSSVYSKICRLRKKFNLIDRNKKIISLPKTFSSELAELLGLIFSDGYIHKHYVCFYNTSEALLDRFQYLISKYFKLKDPKMRIKPSGAVEVLYYSMDLSNFINQFINKKSKIPKEILNGKDAVKTAFLRGYFSGDGGVCLCISYKSLKKKFELCPFVFVACNRKNITESLAQILKFLNFNFVYNDKTIRIGRMKDIIKFYNEISFVNGCTITKHSKNWNGFEKNQLLKYVVTSLRNDTKLKGLTYSSTKEEIVNYIKNQLADNDIVEIHLK